LQKVYTILSELSYLKIACFLPKRAAVIVNTVAVLYLDYYCSCSCRNTLEKNLHKITYWSCWQRCLSNICKTYSGEIRINTKRKRET